MKNKCLVLVMTLLLSVITVPFVAAEDVEMTTEYAPITEVLFSRDYEGVTLTKEENYETFTNDNDDTNEVNTIISVGENSALKIPLNSAEETTIVADEVRYDLSPAITEDKIEITFNILPIETDGKAARFYLQLLSGSNKSIQFQFDSSASTSRYAMLLGSSNVILSRDDLNHLSADATTVDASEFNEVRLVLVRERDESGTATGGTMEVYLNGDAKHPEGGYDITALGSNCQFKDYTINRIKFYYVTSSASYNNPPQAMYLNDIAISGTSEVEYYPDELSINFDAAMDYSGDVPVINITNGTDSKYLQQKVALSLVNAADESDVTELNSTTVTKTEGESAVFSFAEPVNVEPGYYYVSIKRYIGGEEKGAKSSKRIYIATNEQLAALPGDFSELPDDVEMAMDTVESYLPCFLTDEEISELMPSANEALAQANLKFITQYFQNSTNSYTKTSEVQTAFTKAKTYLALYNAEDGEDACAILKSNNYLEEYLENDIFVENKEEFLAFFETKRADEANPLLSDKQIADALRYSIAMTGLNNALRSEIEGLVEKYNDIYGLDITVLEALNADELYTALYNNNYQSISDIQADWTERVTELKEQEEDDGDSGSSSSGGGGGGGRRASSFKATAPIEVAPQIAPDETVDSTTGTDGFNDISGHWAETDIAALKNKGIITGFADGSFRPQGSLTRAELVVMLSRIIPGENTENITVFEDVKADDWFCQAVAKAAGAGIVQGTDGKFMPNSAITREQLAVIIYRAIGKSDSAIDAISFADSSDISEYAKDAINYLASRGILSGFEDNTMRPKQETSRAEAAKLLNALLNELVK